MVGAVIYVRLSTKEQIDNLSLPTLLRACEEYCRREGYEVLERFQEEGESAKTTDRTELQTLLNAPPLGYLNALKWSGKSPPRRAAGRPPRNEDSPSHPAGRHSAV